MRILIVEDDPILALITAETLEAEGHVVIGPAHDVTQALRLASENVIDVAFVDINLDGHEEGIYVAKWLRENHKIYSLFVTGQIVAARMLGQEAIGMLSKPFRLEDLVNAALIAQSWLAGETSTAPTPRTLEIFGARPAD